MCAQKFDEASASFSHIIMQDLAIVAVCFNPNVLNNRDSDGDKGTHCSAKGFRQKSSRVQISSTK